MYSNHHPLTDHQLLDLTRHLLKTPRRIAEIGADSILIRDIGGENCVLSASKTPNGWHIISAFPQPTLVEAPALRQNH